MEQWEEVREYVGNSGNVANREEFFTHVVSNLHTTAFIFITDYCNIIIILVVATEAVFNVTFHDDF